MPNTFALISSVTVGAGGSATMDLTSIPSSYTDLRVYVSARSVRAQTQDGMNIKFNSSTSSFTTRYIGNIGGGLSSYTATTACGSIPAATANASTFSCTSIYITDYAGSGNKTFSIESVRPNNSATVFEIDVMNGIWSNSSAITSISFYNDNSNFAQYSTAYLFGIKNS
jgi:hypothetical protein